MLWWLNPWGAFRKERARHAANLRHAAEINAHIRDPKTGRIQKRGYP